LETSTPEDWETDPFENEPDPAPDSAQRIRAQTQAYQTGKSWAINLHFPGEHEWDEDSCHPGCCTRIDPAPDSAPDTAPDSAPDSDSNEGLGKKLFLSAIVVERARQDAKFGDQSEHTDELWNMILSEGVGEVARAALEHRFRQAQGAPPENIHEHREHLEKELVEVAAVCCAWYETLLRWRSR
jgi:hypothetical protein